MAETQERQAKTPEQIAMRKAARLIAYTAWLQTYRAEHPEASDSERKAAWGAVKADEMKKGRKVLKALERKGYALTPPVAAAKAA